MSNGAGLGGFIAEATLLLACVALAVLFALVSYVAQTGHWFARSGSLIVLLAVICEFRLGAKYSARWPDHATSRYLQHTPVPESGTTEKVLRWASHLAVVVGTLIWGYGDLLFPDPCCVI